MPNRRWPLSVFVTAQSFSAGPQAALLLNSYDALRRFRQGDQFIKRNESMEHRSYAEKCGGHQNYFYAKLT